ncbi:acyl-CoA thioesterase [Glaciihabitans tibetensis]|uniref:Acyl-CoA thioesterase n=1 Tax=Glaciihabitans tibetensis TaxID=1266600 RepID=A0A2T0VJX1_9MICO|nr:acyl-CoA thioesterase domain-containing protein [Glaciihabitans tibetensis]PRY70517.1 acyl-CoA thioesterase [Glaciihabitans tibetensis]
MRIPDVAAAASPGRARTAVEVDFDSAWAIESMFGGAVAVACVEAARTVCGTADAAPIATSIRFLAPTPVGRATIVVDVVRVGRSFTTAHCEVESGGRTTASMIVTFAPAGSVSTVEEHSSPTQHPAPEQHSSPNPSGLPPSALSEGAGSSVAQQVDWRTAVDWTGEGPWPEVFTSWLRLRGWTGDPTDPARYLLAADLIGPALAARGIALPFRVATVSLDVSTVRRTASQWLVQRIVVRAVGTAAVADLELLTPGGVVVATATQHAVLTPATAEDLPFAATGFGWGRP